LGSKDPVFSGGVILYPVFDGLELVFLHGLQ